jgi:class 3 adenylate cyclase
LSEIERLQLEIEHLNAQLKAEKSGAQFGKTLDRLGLMMLRWDRSGIIRFINEPFCDLLHVGIGQITGRPLSTLRHHFSRDLVDRIKACGNQKGSFEYYDIARDKQFEVTVAPTGDGTFDLVFKDISELRQLEQFVRRYLPNASGQLQAEDLKTFHHPELRNMSVSFTNLQNYTQQVESNSPGDVRLVMNACFEEITKAICDNHATVDKIIGEEVMSMVGAPFHNPHHALIAIRSACEQMNNLKALRKSFVRSKINIPEIGIGIHSGNMILGNIGSSFYQDYTVVGHNVQIALHLSQCSEPDQVLCSEVTLQSICDTLPKNWEMTREKRPCEKKPCVNELSNHVTELSQELKDLVVYLGPNVKETPDEALLKFRYLYSTKPPKSNQSVMVLELEEGHIHSKNLNLEPTISEIKS